jgi:MFS superfamily sulfate permease-like transporter
LIFVPCEFHQQILSIEEKIRYYRLIWMKYDLPAGLSVFLVALPLCLGIALASEAPLYSGILSGIIGGIVVSLISGSQLAVSGPAAGLSTVACGVIGAIPMTAVIVRGLPILMRVQELSFPHLRTDCFYCLQLLPFPLH